MTGYTEILAYKPDVIVAGAGFSGLVAARIFAENGRRVLVLEKRTHLGGNAFDEKDTETGLTVHRYGPHIFHTNNREVFEFLSRFTDWNGYEHKVLANVHKVLRRFPSIWIPCGSRFRKKTRKPWNASCCFGTAKTQAFPFWIC